MTRSVWTSPLSAPADLVVKNIYSTDRGGLHGERAHLTAR
jgi:hypothetical protein